LAWEASEREDAGRFTGQRPHTSSAPLLVGSRREAAETKPLSAPAALLPATRGRAVIERRLRRRGCRRGDRAALSLLRRSTWGFRRIPSARTFLGADRPNASALAYRPDGRAPSALERRRSLGRIPRFTRGRFAFSNAPLAASRNDCPRAVPGRLMLCRIHTGLFSKHLQSAREYRITRN
jgi:hypothetical protein